MSPDSFSDSFSERMPYQDFVDTLVKLGMTAVYVTESTYRHNLSIMDKNTVLVYNHSTGETVILLGDNEIDHVRFKFGPGRSTLRD